MPRQKALIQISCDSYFILASLQDTPGIGLCLRLSDNRGALCVRGRLDQTCLIASAARVT